jgi:hypothetical protein
MSAGGGRRNGGASVTGFGASKGSSRQGFYRGYAQRVAQGLMANLISNLLLELMISFGFVKGDKASLVTISAKLEGETDVATSCAQEA